MSSTLQQFAKVIDEVREGCGGAIDGNGRCTASAASYLSSPYIHIPSLSVALLQLSSCHAVLSTQLADAMMFPITQFKERDLKGRRTRPTSVHSLLFPSWLSVRQSICRDRTAYISRERQNDFLLLSTESQFSTSEVRAPSLRRAWANCGPFRFVRRT